MGGGVTIYLSIYLSIYLYLSICIFFFKFCTLQKAQAFLQTVFIIHCRVEHAGHMLQSRRVAMPKIADSDVHVTKINVEFHMWWWWPVPVSSLPSVSWLGRSLVNLMEDGWSEHLHRLTRRLIAYNILESIWIRPEIRQLCVVTFM